MRFGGGLGQHTGLDQFRARNLATGSLAFALLELFLVAVDSDGFVFRELRGQRRHGDDVAVSAQAVELRFDKLGPLPARARSAALLDGLVHRDRVGAVDRHARNAERGCLLGKRIAGDGVRVLEAVVGVGLILIVFENVNNR